MIVAERVPAQADGLADPCLGRGEATLQCAQGSQGVCIRLDGDGLDGELLGARDGDATDVGEIRYLGESPGATAMIFDTAGVLYAGRVGRIDALEDLDGDGDFWNHEADAWDAGEQRVWADGFPGRIYELEFGPDGDLWVGFAIDATQEAGIARIAGPWPD